MPTIQHRAARIDVPGIVSGDWTSAKLLRTIAAADKRFNASLKGVMKAAELVAACDTAGELGAIEVTSETAKMIAASIRDPEGWGYPTGAYQLLEFLRALLADLGQPEAA